MSTIPTQIYQTPVELAKRALQAAGHVNGTLHEMLSVRNGCDAQGFHGANAAIGRFIYGDIHNLGGMAGEW